EALGAVLVRRVKGEHGGIEIVTATDLRGAVRGDAIQSQREPDSIARQITGRTSLGAFVGKNASCNLRLAEDLPDVAPLARASAQAIADGVRSQLVMLSAVGEPERPG